MPLLQFDTTLDLTAAEKTALTTDVTALYAEEMATTTGHVAVVVREHAAENLSLGRAVDGPLCFLNADVRAGRSFERKRTFALATMDLVHDRFDVPNENLKVVFSEHAGEEMMGVDRVGGDWSDE
jgi:phenylpyruvate tautomerase PptA (4-oxalocrotonate tautomerase family)